MTLRWKQRLTGLSFTLLGGGFTLWSWNAALNEGYFHRRASILFPAVCVIGLGLILFPGYKEERIARGEDISQMKGWKLITLRWWVILAVALIAGIVNALLVSVL